MTEREVTTVRILTCLRPELTHMVIKYSQHDSGLLKLFSVFFFEEQLYAGETTKIGHCLIDWHVPIGTEVTLLGGLAASGGPHQFLGKGIIIPPSIPSMFL